MAGKFKVLTELGKITHRYWYGAGYYFREPLGGGEMQYWVGDGWKGLMEGQPFLSACAVTHKAA
jgi:hypothetical protein